MKMYDEGSIGTAIKSDYVETHAGDIHVYKDRTQAGSIVFITTDNFKNYIPVEWIKRWIDNISSNPRYKVIGEIRNISPTNDVEIAVPCVSDMLNDWEKENGRIK